MIRNNYFITSTIGSLPKKIIEQCFKKKLAKKTTLISTDRSE